MLAVAPAQAVVIDFESLAVNDRKFHFLPSYTEDGFTITNDAVSRYGINTPDQLLAYWGTQFSGFAGSTALFNNTAATTTNLAQVGGGAFSLSSIDLADLFDAGDPTTINFTGNIAGGGTVSQSFTTDSLKGLKTFTFSNFTNLASVDWTVASYMQFDNINVSAAGTTAVPEPFTVLGTIFGAGYGVALKRKLAKAKQAKEDIS
jgi:hypothetical protein